MSDAVHRLGTNQVSFSQLVASGLSVEASRHVLVIEQDLALSPTASAIDIIELGEDMR